MDKLNIPELSALLTEQTHRLGPDHVDTLATRHLLARRIAEREGYAQAIPLYEQLVFDRSRVLGDRHRDTLTSRHNLALCLVSCGRIESARTMFEEVIRLLEETYGKDDDHTIRTRQWYLNDVIAELEPPKDVVREYEALFKIISLESRRRLTRNRKIREQFEEFLDRHEGLLVGPTPLVPVDDDSKELEKDKAVNATEPRSYEPKLETYLAKLALNELGGELDVWQQAIATDAREISQIVVGSVDAEIEQFLHTRFRTTNDDVPEWVQFDILQKLVGLGSGPALRLASQISLAYVDFAFFSIHVAGADPESSRSKIDALRLQLRQILGETIDTTSDAEIDFERNFREIVGLDTVKRELLGFIRVLIENKRQFARGGEVEPPRLHLSLVGNPGTGKTVVARLYCQLLYQLGFFSSEKFTEIDKSHLVGPYSGDAERCARDIIEAASPGVLFIDEAYTLNDPFSNVKGPGQRALEVIMKAMEDRRATLAVIFAGYKKEMDELMKVNPGLPSRIGSTIVFPNYSLDELIEIAQRAASKRGLKLDAEAQQSLYDVLRGLLLKPDFGNAREVESIIEEAQRSLVNRLAPLDDMATTAERRTILQSDIPRRELPAPKKVGFLQ